jgi:CheY-like chemotaxis protein
MAKILLVEDDNNLREIYGERLIAEGYEIISAGDGEEALQTAVQEKPDLIISDVMMPKISGFDMLDILRQTPETKDVKIIMMTALSQAEDKSRADTLGADKYLVKSQVTLEDVARVVHDLLGDGGDSEAATVISEATEATAQVSTPTPEATSEPLAVVDEPKESIETAPQPNPVPVVAPEQVQAAPTVNENSVNNPIQPMASPTPVEAPVRQVSSVMTEPVVPQVVEPIVEAPVVSQPVVNTETPVPQVETATQAAVDQTVNPITGQSVISESQPQASDTLVQAQDTQSELNELNQQIEQFAQQPVNFEPLVQAPVQEPTEQQMIHAQNAAEEPQVLSAQPAQSQMVNPPMPSANIDAANPEPASSRKKVIVPVNDLSAGPDIHALYEQEMAKEAASSPVINPNSGAVINGEYLQQSSNPIADANQSPQEASAQIAPLETVDPTQIVGVQMNAESGIIDNTQQDTQPTQPQTPNPVNSPNNIAL